MNASAAIANSLLRRACMRLVKHAGGRARRSVGQRTTGSMPPSFAAPRARLATRLCDFAKNRHEQSGLAADLAQRLFRHHEGATRIGVQGIGRRELLARWGGLAFGGGDNPPVLVLAADVA